MIEITVSEWINLAAIALGPMGAVLLTRYLDDRRFQRERKMSVFRDLMRTRKQRMTAEHVSALNLVEIEFSKDLKVTEAWEKYFQHLHKKIVQEEVATHVVEQEFLLAKLLDAMARCLKFSHLEQIDIMKGGYSPQGWFEEEIRQKTLSFLLLQLLRGNIALPVTQIHSPNVHHPYPEAPELTEEDEGQRIKIPEPAQVPPLAVPHPTHDSRAT